MGMTAGCTDNTYNGHGKYFVIQLDPALISSVSDQASGMPARAWNKCQIKRIYNFIVRILGDMLVVFYFYCYHKRCYSSNVDETAFSCVG